MSLTNFIVDKMMNWAPYPSLYKERDDISKLPDGTWIVTEKIHGCNFCIEMTEEGKFRYFSRNQEVTETNRDFWNRIAPKRDVWESKLTANWKTGKNILIYGELFGGCYPNEKGKLVKAGAIQTGIVYSPAIEFIAFDIKVDGEFLPFFESSMQSVALGLDFVPAVYMGERDQVYKWVQQNVETFITMRQKPGLVKGTIYENPVAEGFCFRHITQHVLVKRRSSAFHEVIRKPLDKTQVASPEVVDVTPYITLVRLDNVRSKRVDPELTKETLGDWLKEFSEDVRKDMTEEGLVWNTKQHMKLCGKFIRDQLEAQK